MSNYRNKDIQRYAEVFKALSNPNRLQIFLRLVSCCVPGTVHRMNASCQCIGDLGQDLEIVPSTLSHHVKELQRVGLIRCQRRGQKVECSIDPELLRELAGFFRSGNFFEKT
ncbi:MAG: helix-turn-helix transcriptional regulator [Deltaproteobacteria bacterium]|nr:helix-turn-helix transcriptional regulator [Deltaproteobacteria bacterium]